MGIELIECLSELTDKKDLRVLILTGTGEKSFCAGADLKERKTMDNEQWKKQHDIFEDAYEMLREFPLPSHCCCEWIRAWRRNGNGVKLRSSLSSRTCENGIA